MAKRKPGKGRTRSRASARAPDSTSGPVELDEAQSLERVMALMAIPGRSGEEGAVAKYVRGALRAAGAPASSIEHDRANERPSAPGQVGNLALRLPGTLPGPRRLLVSHMDTVPICVGARPVRKGNRVASADRHTGLGADNRAGVAVLLTAAVEILRRGLPHPPLTFLWTVQEEIGIRGARHVRLGMLGRPRLAFNFDGGAPEKLTVGATGGYRMQIEVRGLASHAGGAPEKGVSAVAIAALAIAELEREGWHGLIRQKSGEGTSNVGMIEGGTATNVVTDLVRLRAEARSHDPKFRARIVRRIERAFQGAARKVKNDAGRAGQVKIEGHLDYESYLLPGDAPCVAVAEAAVRAVGREPLRAVANGGIDANWLTARGIPTVSFGCGQRMIHTVKEQLDLPDFQLACRIGLHVATGR